MLIICWREETQTVHRLVLKDKSDVNDSQAADDVENSTPSDTVTSTLPRDPDVSVERWYPQHLHHKIPNRYTIKGKGV